MQDVCLKNAIFWYWLGFDHYYLIVSNEGGGQNRPEPTVKQGSSPCSLFSKNWDRITANEIVFFQSRS